MVKRTGRKEKRKHEEAKGVFKQTERDREGEGESSLDGIAVAGGKSDV